MLGSSQADFSRPFQPRDPGPGSSAHTSHRHCPPPRPTCGVRRAVNQNSGLLRRQHAGQHARNELAHEAALHHNAGLGLEWCGGGVGFRGVGVELHVKSSRMRQPSTTMPARRWGEGWELCQEGGRVACTAEIEHTGTQV
jgi:hypothetical protein